MTTLETIKESIISHRDSAERFPFRHLCLAYIALHMENPGLHPDDYLYDGSGYAGWMVILVHRVLGHEFKLPDNFEYPCSFLKIVETLEELRDFHTDIAEDKEDDEQYHMDHVAFINSALFWFEEMKPSELDGIVDGLQKLYLYHACEDDSAEEEAEKPAGIIKDVADVLFWVQTK